MILAETKAVGDDGRRSAVPSLTSVADVALIAATPLMQCVFHLVLSFEGNIRMFYPTCYVYKIGPIDEATPNSEPNAAVNKKTDITTTKKSKLSPACVVQPTSTVSTCLDLLSNASKTESTLLKNLANQLLISAQRNNCIDPEKKYVLVARESCRPAPSSLLDKRASRIRSVHRSTTR